MQAHGTVQGMTDDHPLFAFAFRGGRGRALRELEEFDVATSDVDNTAGAPCPGPLMKMATRSYFRISRLKCV